MANRISLECAFPSCKNTFETVINKNGRPQKMYCCKRHKDLAYSLNPDRKLGVEEVSPSSSIDLIDTKDLIAEIHKRGFYVSKEPLSHDERFRINIKRFEGNRYVFGLVSDTHLGSKFQQLSHLWSFYQLCKERGVEQVFHCGDLCEGDGSLYKGQMYEMFLHGTDAQAEYIIKNYPKMEGITTYVIGGSHDYSFHKSLGLDILRLIVDSREDIKYLGMQGAYIDMGKILIYLMHPDGGTAYALSYRAQKIIENFAPEGKPHLLFIGHFHRPCWLIGYRNVHALQLPCFQAQTPYLRGKGLQPFVGGMICEIVYNESGIVSMKPEILPFYKIIQDDY